MIVKKTLKWNGKDDFLLIDFYQKISDYHNIISNENNLYLIDENNYSEDFLDKHKNINFDDFEEKYNFLINEIKKKAKSFHEYDNIINSYNNIISIKNKIENSENILNILKFSELLQDTFLKRRYNAKNNFNDSTCILTVQFENKNIEYFYFEPLLFTIANDYKENKIIYKDKENKERINIFNFSYHYLNRNILNKLLSFIGVSYIKKNTYDNANTFKTLASDKSKYYENDLNLIQNLSFEIDVHFNTDELILLFDVKNITGNWYDKNDSKNKEMQKMINEINSEHILKNVNKRMIVSLSIFHNNETNFILSEYITKYF